MSRLHIDQQVTFMFCDDLGEARRFYGDVLELEEVLDQGTCAIFSVTSTAFVGLCEREVPDRSSCIFTFVVDDVDGVHAELVDRGVECEHPPRRNDRYDIYHFFALDPFGNRLEFQRFEDPSWPRSID